MNFRAVLLTAVIALTGCDETPTGRSQLALVPDAVMADMGQQAFAQLKERVPVATDPAIKRLVECVSREVVEATAEQYPGAELPESWEVVLFEDPSPNAFALPGGRIGVHTGLLKVAESPSQLAAVIGHEVGHVLANHGNERLTQQLGIDAALLLVGLFGEGEIANQQILEALGVGAQLGVALPFSRAHEREADLMGLRIMAAAGFDPRASIELWRNMAAQGGSQPFEFLSTHPAHGTRIEALREAMETAVARYEQAKPPGCG